MTISTIYAIPSSWIEHLDDRKCGRGWVGRYPGGCTRKSQLTTAESKRALAERIRAAKGMKPKNASTKKAQPNAARKKKPKPTTPTGSAKTGTQKGQETAFGTIRKTTNVLGDKAFLAQHDKVAARAKKSKNMSFIKKPHPEVPGRKVEVFKGAESIEPKVNNSRIFGARNVVKSIQSARTEEAKQQELAAWDMEMNLVHADITPEGLMAEDGTPKKEAKAFVQQANKDLLAIWESASDATKNKWAEESSDSEPSDRFSNPITQKIKEELFARKEQLQRSKNEEKRRKKAQSAKKDPADDGGDLDDIFF